jgi:hypothetical protein
VSIIETLIRLVDPAAAREREAERERFRVEPGREEAGPPPAFACRVCDHLGPEPRFCPVCLAETMRPTDRVAPAADAPAPGDATAAPGAPAEAPPVEIPIDGTLDLHTVRPAEVAALVTEYLQACLERGIHDVRIVHGKGKGHLKRTVEVTLERCPLVATFRTADESAGGWGATLVTLARR